MDEKTMTILTNFARKWTGKEKFCLDIIKQESTQDDRWVELNIVLGILDQKL
jgi:hypothetical protein